MVGVTAGERVRLRQAAETIFRAAIQAVEPRQLVRRVLRAQSDHAVVQGPDGREHHCSLPVLVVGAGKATARMAAGCEDVLGAHVFGEVIVADGTAVELCSITVTEAGHPLPDERGLMATRRLVERVRQPHDDALLCLVSGGASSLLVNPRAPITLAEKTSTTELLLQCGAAIGEINTVRKHLSTVKGGGLLQQASRPVVSLLISDVIGDDLATIGSGPTAPDPTTFSDAMAILKRYALQHRLSGSVTAVLERGMRGEIPETLKPDSPRAALGTHLIIGSNRYALEAAAAVALQSGWAVIIDSQPLSGDTTTVAQAFAARLRQLATHRPPRQPLCLLAGGETTVRVLGIGRGGRNQEFALAMAPEIAGRNITVLSAGTDGIDGPTDAAGAYVDGTTLQRARQAGLNPQSALSCNDSYTFFRQLGDLFRCGPTGTNVMDVKIALVGPDGSPGSCPTPVLGT